MSLSATDRAIRIAWHAVAVVVLGSAITQRWLPGAIVVGVVPAWVMMVVVWWRRRTLFPEIVTYSAEVQDAFTFFGWFGIALITGGGALLWLFGN